MKNSAKILLTILFYIIIGLLTFDAVKYGIEKERLQMNMLRSFSEESYER